MFTRSDQFFPEKEIKKVSFLNVITIFHREIRVLLLSSVTRVGFDILTLIQRCRVVESRRQSTFDILDL